MSVTVDHQPLAAEELGLRTVGQVLAHLQRERRLVVHVLIDGHEPDPQAFPAVKGSCIDGHTLFIETADPRQLACEALLGVEEELREADRLRAEAADLLGKNQNVKAMEKLSGCFSTWQAAQESVLKTAQLLRVDLDQLRVGPLNLTELLTEFTAQLRQIKAALEQHDFVHLNDILTYEATQTAEQWTQAINALRAVIEKEN
jgi:hypothetical protein